MCFRSSKALMLALPHLVACVGLFFPHRNCIGQTFAMNQLKVVTALTLKRYELIEDPTLKPKIAPRVVLKSLNGIYIKIKSIDQQE